MQAALDTMIDRSAAGCTIMIAHRLSTVRNCHQILAMEKGHVIERGTHDELLEVEIEKSASGKTVKGLYRELWETQHGKTSDAPREVALLKAEVARLKAALDARSSEVVNDEVLTRTPSTSDLGDSHNEPSP